MSHPQPPKCPIHWREFHSQSDWYTLRYPPTWKVRTDPPTIEFLPPHRKAKLVVQCLSVVPKVEGIEAPVEKLIRTGPGIRESPLIDFPYKYFSAEGDAAAMRTAQTHGDLTESGKWERWKCWVIHDKTLVLAVSYTQRGNRDVEGETFARLMVSSIRVAGDPLPSCNEFAKMIAARAQEKYPQLNIRLKDDGSIQFGGALLNPYNTYLEFVRTPDRLESILDRVIETSFEVQSPSYGSQMLNPEFEQIRDRILPVPYSRRDWRQRLTHLIGEDWAADLALLYVVDEKNAFWYLTKEHLKSLPITFEELQQLALRNLETYFEQHPMSLVMTPDGGMVLPGSRDSYNASRFISPQFRQQLTAQLGPQFVLGLPQREFFVAVRPDPRADMDAIAGQIASDFDRAEHPLSKRMLLVSPDGVSEYRMK